MIIWSDLGTQNVWPSGNISITIDDSGASMPSVTPALSDGAIYSPNNGGMPPNITMPAITPQNPADYKFTLGAFIGEERHGEWSLWIAVRMNSACQIGGGFDLTIT